MCVFQRPTTTLIATFPLYYVHTKVERKAEEKFIAMHSIRNQRTAAHITSVAFYRSCELAVHLPFSCFPLVTYEKNIHSVASDAKRLNA